MTDRLPWERAPEGGFVAFPEGKDQPGRYARVYRQTHPVTVWMWSVQYGPAKRHGAASSKQSAADVATATWSETKAEGERLEAKETHRANLAKEIERVAAEQDPDVSGFAVETAEYENLMWVMDRLRHQARTPGVLKLMAVLSAEFFARRTKKKAP